MRAMRALVKDTNALAFLRKVDELEIRGERLDDAPRICERQGLGETQEGMTRANVAGAALLGERTHLLDKVKQGVVLLLDDGFAEQIAEEMDLGAERVCVGRQRALLLGVT
jgi:hypothetical protein